jgi:hypothetical protein
LYGAFDVADMISSTPCQYSPVMGPVVFGQSGPLPGMTLVKLLTKNGQPIVPAKVTVSIR